MALKLSFQQRLWTACVAALLVSAGQADVRVLVTDFDNDSIRSFAVIGGAWFETAPFLSGDVDGIAFESPDGLAVDGANNVFVSERVTQGRVLRVDSNGNFLNEIGFEGFDFYGQPSSLTYGPDGFLYMSTFGMGSEPFPPSVGSDEVWLLDPTAEYGFPVPELLIDANSPGEYQLDDPRGMAFGDDGFFYLANRGFYNNPTDPLVPGQDEILRFNINSGTVTATFVDILSQQIDRVTAITDDPANPNTLLVAGVNSIWSVDISGSPIFTLISDGSAGNAPLGNVTDIARIEGTLYYINEDQDLIGAVNEVDGSTTAVVTGLGRPFEFVTVPLGSTPVPVWDGGGANANLTTAANWINDNTPDFNNPDGLLGFAGNQNLQPMNNVSTLQFALLRFELSAGSFTLGGNGFALPEGSRIQNLSPNPQTINTATISAAGGILDAELDSGELIVSAPVDTNSGDLLVEGSRTIIDGVDTLNSQVTLSGSLSGSGTIMKNGGGRLTITGANPGFNGQVQINDNGGYVRVTNANAIGSAPVYVDTGDASALELDGGFTLINAMECDTRNGNAPLESALVSASGVNTLAGTITLSDTGENGNRYLNLRADAGATLNISGAFNSDLPDNGSTARVRANGPGVINWLNSLDDDNDSSNRLELIVSAGCTFTASSAANNYSGFTGIFDDGSILMLAGGGANPIPNTSSIELNHAGATLDLSALTNQTLVLTSATTRLAGPGLIQGGVTFPANATPTIDIDPGTLEITNGLNLPDGTTIDLFADAGSGLRISGGDFAASATDNGQITINVETVDRPDSGTIALIDFTGANPIDIDVADFTVNNLSEEITIDSVDLVGSQLVLTYTLLPLKAVAVHYSMDKLSGDMTTVYNEGRLGAAYDATVVGSPMLGVSGIIGDGITTPGTTDFSNFLETNVCPVAGAADRSVSIWIRSTATTGEYITAMSLGSNNGGAKFDIDTDFSIGGYIECGVGFGRTDASDFIGQPQMIAVGDGQWHLLTAVVGGDQDGDGVVRVNDVLLYVDGVFQYAEYMDASSNTRDINTDGNGRVRVGITVNTDPGLSTYPGDLDDAAIWLRALSDAEIKAVYNAAMDAVLHYNASDIDKLLVLFETGSGTAIVRGAEWSNTSGLAGDPGQIVSAQGGTAVILDEAGNGVLTLTDLAARGACCLTNGTCVDNVLEGECDADLGGMFQGAGTLCDSVNCTATTGACCLPDGSCNDTLDADGCAALFGTFNGLGTTCGEVTCDDTTGACCLPDRTCDNSLNEAGCIDAGGTFLGIGAPCYECVGVPLPQIVVYYSMDNADADTLYNDGTLGEPIDLPRTGKGSFVAGLLGNALMLDGATELGRGNASPLGGDEPRTTAVWVNSATSSLSTMFTFGNNGNGSKWDLDIDADGPVEVGVGFGRTTGSGTAVNDGSWHHVVAVLDSTGDGSSTLADVEIYVDGVFQYTNSGSQIINTDGNGLMRLGTYANGPDSQFLNGLLDDLAIWPRALTPAGIAAVHNAALDVDLGYTAPEVDQLLNLFDEGTGVAVIGCTVWENASGLSGNPGDVINTLDGKGIVLDGSGNGVQTVSIPDVATVFAAVHGPNVFTPPGGVTQTDFQRSDLEADGDVDIADIAAIMLCSE